MTFKPLSWRAALRAGTALSMLAFSAVAHAQEIQDAGEEAEEIVVTGSPIVGSQRAALNQQRNADNLVNVIAADTVGQFPDQNSAAALARLPAVAVQRDQGQERYLQVRGGPNRWTSVSVDGINIIGVDEGGVARAFRFDAVPAVMLSALEVNKSLTPDLPAEAILARVNLRTFSPFDQRGFAVQGDLGYGEMNLGGGKQEQAALRASWSNDRFGIMAAASHYERDQLTDNREFAYDPATGLPIQLDYRLYRVVRSSDAAMAGAEFRPADGHRIFAKTLYSDFKDNEERNQYVFLIGDAISGHRGADSGDLVGVGVRGMFNDGRYKNSNWINTVGGDHDLGGWELEWRVNYTETQNTTNLPMLMQLQTDPGSFVSMTYDRSDPNLPTISLYDTVMGPAGPQRGAARTGLDQSAFDFMMMMPIRSRVETKSWVYKADVRRTLDLGGSPVDLAIGVEYDTREVVGTSMSQSSLPLSAYLPATGMSFDPYTYVTNRAWPGKFPRGFDVNWVDNKRMRPDLDRVLDGLAAAGLYDPEALDPTNLYNIDEDVLAGYASARFKLGPAQIVAGLRVERLKQDISGFVNDAGDGFLPVNAGQSYTDLFPSINIKFDVSKDIVMRLSGQAGISRPSFSVIRSGASVNDPDRIVSAGNPDLKPEKTWGGDASFEYYLPGAGVASVNAFYRHVSNVLFDSSTVIADDRYDVPGLDRTGYAYETTLNGGNGKLYGVELNYMQQFVFLPEGLNGLGFQGNVSFLDGDFKTPTDQTAAFPGVSDTIVNASLFYEKYGFSARFSYQWRSDWIDTLSFNGWGDQTRKAYENLDLSLRYAINDNISLYFDLNNLTNEKYIAFEGDINHPTEVEQIGRRFLGGVRFRF